MNRLLGSCAGLLVLAAGSGTAQPVVIDAGSSSDFTAAAGAASYAWRLNGGILTNAGRIFTFSPGNKEVGTHWICAETTWPGGARSNQHWQARVRITFPTPGTNYYVATNGWNGNPGTLELPFQTLEKARDAIQAGGVPVGGVSVWVRGGVYVRTNTFELSATNSGRAGRPVIYRAYPGETPVFTTGTPILSNHFTTLNPSLWSRVMPGVTASNILELDLVALGIVNRGPFPTEYGRCPIVNPYNSGSDGGLCELYFNGVRQRISRYPNNHPTNRWLTPYMKMNGVIFKLGTNFMGTNIGGMFKYNTSDESHIERWLTAAAETNLWIQGFWRVPWETEGERVLMINTVSNTIATANGATPGVTGFGNKYSGPEGSYNEPYWALNLLEEIDQPGEWSIDFYRKKLYLLPPGPVTNGAVVIADYASPVMRITGGSNIVFNGLGFDRALGQGIVIANATNNLVVGCSFRNLGSYAVDLNYGRSNGVVSCDMTQLAAGAVYVQGGSEAAPRVACDHYVVNNRITDFAQVVPVYAAGVDAGFGGMAGGGGGGGHKVCVGVRIAHNRIQGTPHGPVIRGSFDKVFEYNWIEEYTTVSGDFGGIYCFQNTVEGGFDTLRYNYLHCPTNYVYPTYLNPGPTGGIGIQVDETWAGDELYGNIATGRRGGFGAGGAGGAGAKFYNNFTVNCGQGGINWSGLPAVYATNFAALGSTAITGDLTGPNVSYPTDPGFLDWTNRDLRLDPGSTVYRDLPGFREVPFEMIGLYNDEFRTNATPPAPVIRNRTGATGVTTNSATLQGELVFPWVTPDTTVRVFWGPANGGTNAAGWTNSIHFGLRTRAPLSTNVTGLMPSTTYFYRFQASNSTAVVWATNTVAFVVPNPNYQTTVSFPGYTRSEVLTNIPLLVTLSTNIPDFSYARFSSPTGGDLRFKTADGLTDLNFEIESWNTNGESRVWVQVPELTAATSILARWGDPLATHPPASSTDGSTWNNGYVGVYHLQSTTVADSSPTPQNASANSATPTAGIVNGGLNYNGTSQSTAVPHHGDFNLPSNFEVQGWFRMDPADKADYRTLTSKQIDLNNRNWWIVVRTNGTLWWKSSPGLEVTTGTDLANGQWHHFSAVHDGSVARLYVDGVQAATDSTPGAANTQNSTVYFGLETGSTRYFKGPLDEIRISNVKRSSNWVWAVYQNIASNSTFVGYAAITNLLPTAPESLTASAASGQIILNWTASTGADSYNLKRSTNNGGPYTVIGSLTGLSFTNSGLVNGTTYYYVVAGVNSRGEGLPSPQASAIPLVNSVKANNTLDLDLPGSWLNNTVPTGALAIWDATVTTSGTVRIGNGLNVAGLQIGACGTNIVLDPGSGGTLGLGLAGLDLSSSSKLLTLNAPVTLETNQVWKTGNYGTPAQTQILANGFIDGPGGIELDAANTRAVALVSSQTVTGALVTANSSTVSFATATNFLVGQAITGANIPAGTYIQSIAGTNLTLSAPATTNANPTGTLVIGGNVFSGGVTLNANASLHYDQTIGFVASNGVLISSPLGTGPLTLRGGTLNGGEKSFIHPDVRVHGDFTWATSTRADTSGRFDLGGALRTLSLTRSVSPGGVVVSGGNNSIRFTVLGGLGANRFTNGGLRLAAAGSVAPGQFVVATFGTAGGNQFRNNTPLVVGPQVYGSPSFTGTPFGSASTDKPAVTLETGAFWSVSDGGTGRGHTLFSLSGSGTVLNNTSGTGARTDTLTLDGGSHTGNFAFSGTLRDVDLDTFPTANPQLILALTKTGSTTQILSGTNTYTGPTTVNGGTLVLDGPQGAATGPVLVAAGATLAGTGIIGGAVTIGNGATLRTGEFPARLTLHSNLNLGGTVLLAVGRNGVILTNDAVAVGGSLQYGGTLYVTNRGTTPLQGGDAFQLFPAGGYSGSFTNFIYPPGYTFSNSLATNGRITVQTGPPNTAPALVPLGDLFATAGQWLYVTNSATDLETPPQILTFSLLSAQPGATVNPADGVFAWHIPIAQAGTTETVTIHVADNGTPSLTDTQSFVVFIASPTPPQLHPVMTNNGTFNLWVEGTVGPDYTIQASTNLAAWIDLLTTNPSATPFLWTDADVTNYTSRFYRVRLGP
jgi:autotransporter-associated beta strand protein